MRRDEAFRVRRRFQMWWQMPNVAVIYPGGIPRQYHRFEDAMMNVAGMIGIAASSPLQIKQSGFAFRRMLHLPMTIPWRA